MKNSHSQRILILFFGLFLPISSTSATEITSSKKGIEVKNCVKIKSGKARLIGANVMKCKKNEKLIFIKFPRDFLAQPSQPGPSGAGVISGKGIPQIEIGKIGDFYLDLDTYILYGPKTDSEIWGVGKSLIGPQGPGGRGSQGPPGITTLGYYGSFIDETTETFTTTSKAIPFGTSIYANGVSIENNLETPARKTRITMANAGQYNIQFSSQLYNQGKKGVVFSLWLAKNGSPVAKSSTDVMVGTSIELERHVIAWNFFVDALAGDWYELVAVSSDSVQIISGASQNASNGAPQIPGTILTVNQVG